MNWTDLSSISKATQAVTIPKPTERSDGALISSKALSKSMNNSTVTIGIATMIYILRLAMGDIFFSNVNKKHRWAKS